MVGERTMVRGAGSERAGCRRSTADASCAAAAGGLASSSALAASEAEAERPMASSARISRSLAFHSVGSRESANAASWTASSYSSSLSLACDRFA